MTGFLSIHEECKFRPGHPCVLCVSGAQGGSDRHAHDLTYSGSEQELNPDHSWNLCLEVHRPGLIRALSARAAQRTS
jgi:hypothetical protein